MDNSDKGLVANVGPLAVDVPRSAGYFSGVGLAVGLGLIEPPLGFFIAAIPFFKLFNRPSMSAPVRTVVQFYEGMIKPVGGDGEGTINLEPGRRPTSVLPRTVPRQRSGRARSPRRTPPGAADARKVGALPRRRSSGH